VSSVQPHDLKRLSQPFDNEIFAFAGAVDDKKVGGAIERDQRVMPDAATIVDALAGRRSEGDDPGGIKRTVGRNDDQHVTVAKRRNHLAPERMSLHDFEAKRPGGTFGSHDANAHPAVFRGDIDHGNIAMDRDRSTIC
jgi:hypothetical protein